MRSLVDERCKLRDELSVAREELGVAREELGVDEEEAGGCTRRGRAYLRSAIECLGGTGERQGAVAEITSYVLQHFEAFKRSPYLLGRCNICGNYTAFFCGDRSRYRESLHCAECKSTSRNRSIALGLLRAIGELTGESPRSIAELRWLPVGRKFQVFDAQNSFYTPDDAYPIPDLLRQSGSFEVETLGHGDITRLPFAEESFDIVITSDLMEHVENDVAAHSEIRRVLRHAGVYVFTVTHSRTQTRNVLPLPGPKDEHGRYRIYGRELDDALAALGFSVEYSMEGHPEIGVMDSELFFCRLTRKE